jgi:hypothetical protein
MTQQDFKELKRICIATHAEVLHLKKLLVEKGVIHEDDKYDFANSLEEYVAELDAKTRELVKTFPHLGDQ